MMLENGGDISQKTRNRYAMWAAVLGMYLQEMKAHERHLFPLFIAAAFTIAKTRLSWMSFSG